MQGSFEQTAKICRYIMELHNEGHLTGFLEVSEDAILLKSRKYARDVGEVIKAAYGEEFGASAVRSAIQKTLPGFTGLEVRNDFSPPTGTSSVSLEARVTVLEKRVAELLEALS